MATTYSTPGVEELEHLRIGKAPVQAHPQNRLGKRGPQFLEEVPQEAAGALAGRRGAGPQYGRTANCSVSTPKVSVATTGR